MQWSPDIYPYLQEENYTEVSQYYEELIEAEPEIVTNYWLLGLAYLLEGKEDSARFTWLSMLMEVDRIKDLSEILEEEATRQKELGHLSTCLLIREYLQEINPHLANNKLEIILLSRQLETFNFTLIIENGVIVTLQETETGLVDFNLLLEVLINALEYPSLDSVELLRVSLPHLLDYAHTNQEAQSFFLQRIEPLIIKIAYEMDEFPYAVELIKLCLQLQPENIYLLKNLFTFCLLLQDYVEAEKTIEKISQLASGEARQLYGQYLRLTLAMHQGKWLNIEPLVKEYKTLLNSLNQSKSQTLASIVKQYSHNFIHILSYIEDNPRENRQLQNKLSQLFQNELKIYQIPTVRPKNKLKIGYLAGTLRRHSVGWLSRWLFHYHDPERFEINLYLIKQKEDDITREWFVKNAHSVRRCEPNHLVITQQIKDDKIDILIDLDSLTSSVTCWVLSLKPAPIQVTWLGLDATGIPNVDYFIVDPYVLPDTAQEYYQEKLWRLPQTYLAVDGFEIGVPTLTREELNIPSDAVIYLTSQIGMKRHPETIRMQLKILKAVPNSYLLIKGLADFESVREIFFKLAEAEGIKTERLRFLPISPTEEIHRSNLTIADIVLDTYPYNGATTTLEVLWMAIPLVTLVGTQFAARNSYTFMLNAGITEGIAFSRDEYIEWGIKLGLNEYLREKIHWKLLKNRQTAPLWNAKKFTQEMENAYSQMWNNLLLTTPKNELQNDR